MTQMQSKTPVWLAYLAGWLTGLIFLAVEKNDEDMRWHAAQSLTLFGAVQIVMIILWRIPIIGTILNAIIGLGAFILWILLMVKANQGERFRVPVAVDFAEKYVINWFK